MNINLTLFGQMVTFAIFVWFCMKFVWPVILSAMEERQEKIAQGLAAADQAIQDLAVAKSSVNNQMQVAKKEAADIIDQANKRAAQIIENAKKQAVEEGDRLRQAARADIQQDFNRAREELRGSVAELVLVGSEKVLQKSIDDSTHRELVDNLAQRL